MGRISQPPRDRIGIWVVGFIVITTLLNILSIKVADEADYVLMAFSCGSWCCGAGHRQRGVCRRRRGTGQRAAVLK